MTCLWRGLAAATWWAHVEAVAALWAHAHADAHDAQASGPHCGVMLRARRARGVRKDSSHRDCDPELFAFLERRVSAPV